MEPAVELVEAVRLRANRGHPSGTRATAGHERPREIADCANLDRKSDDPGPDGFSGRTVEIELP